MKLTTFEFTQRAENGGSPLDNETAHDLGVGHGTSLLVIPKREFVAFLKCVRDSAKSVQIHYGLLEDVEELLKEHDDFVFEVSPDELTKTATCGKAGCGKPSTGQVWGDLRYETCDEHRAEIEKLTENE